MSNIGSNGAVNPIYSNSDGEADGFMLGGLAGASAYGVYGAHKAGLHRNALDMHKSYRNKMKDWKRGNPLPENADKADKGMYKSAKKLEQSVNRREALSHFKNNFKESANAKYLKGGRAVLGAGAGFAVGGIIGAMIDANS